MSSCLSADFYTHVHRYINYSNDVKFIVFNIFLQDKIWKLRTLKWILQMKLFINHRTFYLKSQASLRLKYKSDSCFVYLYLLRYPRLFNECECRVKRIYRLLIVQSTTLNIFSNIYEGWSEKCNQLQFVTKIYS